MFAIIRTEFQKIKRYHILLIGILGMVCSPLLQLFSQAIVAEEFKNPHYDCGALLRSTIWGNATIFMPVIFTLTGGYLIDREYRDDTLKNILTVPISFRRFLAGKLAAMGIFSVLFGIFSFVITVVVAGCAGLSDMSGPVLAGGLLQMIGLSVGVYIVVLPIITICSRRPGFFMGGSVIAFILGYCCMFFKEGMLRDIYPFSAALTLIGFDTADFAGTSDRGSIPLGMASMGVMVLFALAFLWTSKAPEHVKKIRKKKSKGFSQRPAQRKRQKAV